MLDALLRRIASRGSVDLGDGKANASNALSSGVNDPFNTAYPVRLKRGPDISAQSGNPWLEAADAAMLARSRGGLIPDQPAFFAKWGLAQLAVARVLWAERRNLGAEPVRIMQGERDLAAVIPASRRVLLQESLYQTGGSDLLIRPAQQGRAIDDGAVLGKGIQAYQLSTLRWFYGQVDGGAPDLLPPEMGLHLLELRRLPQVDPAALQMRHLALIHIFSSGALSFAHVRSLIAPAHSGSLCADLASLYLTGALHLRHESTGS